MKSGLVVIDYFQETDLLTPRQTTVTLGGRIRVCTSNQSVTPCKQRAGELTPTVMKPTHARVSYPDMLSVLKHSSALRPI